MVNLHVVITSSTKAIDRDTRWPQRDTGRYLILVIAIKIPVTIIVYLAKLNTEARAKGSTRSLQGNVGIVGRSGTLGYEAASQLKERGIGVSTSVGIGGDPINGSSFKDILERFENDEDTHVIALIGEIGGREEELAAEYLKSEAYGKPVIALVVGRHAPEGRRMGHAGTLSAVGGLSAADKINLLNSAGALIADTLRRGIAAGEVRTADQGGTASTTDVAKAVAAALTGIK